MRLYAAHQYADALVVAERAVGAARSQHGELSRPLATALCNRAILHEATQQPAKAAADYNASLSILRRLARADDPDVAWVSDNLAGLYRNTGSYTAGEALLRDALRIRTARFGDQSLEVATSLAHLGLLFGEEGDYREAERAQRQALKIREAAGQEAEDDVSVSLNDLASTLEQEGQYDEAEQKAKQSLEMRRRAVDADPANIAVTEDNLAEIYADEGRYTEAEELHKISLARRKAVLPPNDPDIAYPLNNLAHLYADEGHYKDAEQLYLQALELRTRALGARSALVAATLDNLAALYVLQDRFAEAEPLYERAVEIDESIFGKNAVNVTDVLNNLAEMYEAEQQYDAAEGLLKRVLKIRTLKLPPLDLATAGSLTNLAVLYEERSRYREAEPLAQRAVAIYERRLTGSHPLTAKAQNNLAIIYEDEKRNQDAERMFRRSLAATEAADGPDHPEVGVTLNNLALLYKSETRYPEAIAYYERALHIAESTQAADGGAVGTTLTNLAMTYYAAGQPADAVKYFERALLNRRAQFRHQFAHMNERERLNFLKETSGLMPVFVSFATQFQGQFPQLSDEVYDLLLWIKGIVVGSMTSERALLEQERDPTAVTLFDRLTATKRALATLDHIRSTNYQDVGARRSELTRQADDVEKQLAARSAQFASTQRMSESSWSDIRGSLHSGEAAVEYVAFGFHDGRQWRQGTKYAALVVTRDANHPELLLLPDAPGERPKPVLDDYRKWVTATGTLLEEAAGRAVAARFWEPIVPHLQGATRIYIAPDGVLDLLTFGVLPGASARLLMQDYDLRLLASTRDLLRPELSPYENTAALFGDPRFSLSEDRSSIANDHAPRSPLPGGTASPATTGPSITRRATTSLRDSASRCRDALGRRALCPLPQTEAEVVNLAKSLAAHSWQISGPFTQDRARKETILAVEHPRLLHIATHGFWSEAAAPSTQPDREVSLAQDPMLRSGLYLAGADRSLPDRGEVAASTGVLTAYEMATMDLRGTELVVLSACDTGLGSVRNGEGVFGLRRGLQEAGAAAILMALWAIPEQETRETMSRFYEKWLGGEEKHQALREAELAERDEVIRRWGFDRKDLWAAFVIVGK